MAIARNGQSQVDLLPGRIGEQTASLGNQLIQVAATFNLVNAGILDGAHQVNGDQIAILILYWLTRSRRLVCPVRRALCCLARLGDDGQSRRLAAPDFQGGSGQGKQAKPYQEQDIAAFEFDRLHASLFRKSRQA